MCWLVTVGHAGGSYTPSLGTERGVGCDGACNGRGCWLGLNLLAHSRRVQAEWEVFRQGPSTLSNAPQSQGE